jgi:hypothetical protein
MVTQDRPYLGDTSRSPIVAATIGSIVSAFLAVGFIASYLPRPAPMAWPVGFLIASGLLWVAGLALLLRLQRFAWSLFFAVARWISVLTVLFAGMAVYVFIADGTSGGTLAVMVTVLVLAAINIPIVVGFSVARHEREPATGEQD